jgi:DNA-binding protein Fis
MPSKELLRVPLGAFFLEPAAQFRCIRCTNKRSPGESAGHCSEGDVMEDIDKMFLTIGRGKVYNRVIGDTERMLIEGALKRAFGNQSIAAKILGINRNTMRAKVRKLNIDPAKFRI